MGATESLSRTTYGLAAASSDANYSLDFGANVAPSPAPPCLNYHQLLGAIQSLTTFANTATVTMPPLKITKAQDLIASALTAPTPTRTAFRSLLGLLRHVATCVRPAKFFLQCLREGDRKLHRYSRVQVSATMRDDLGWWWHILHDPSLNGVPLEYFGELPEPDITVVTDASDAGLCATVPAHQLAHTYRFSSRERDLIHQFKQGHANEFDINYRKLLACAFAVKTWAPEWGSTHRRRLPTHVHFRINNTSAVSWQSKMATRNSRAQVLIRLMGVWEPEFHVRISASHIPGAENVVADAGSRHWENESFAQVFLNSTRGWRLAPSQTSISGLEHDWRGICESTALPIHPLRPTSKPSPTGNDGPDYNVFRGTSTSP